MGEAAAVAAQLAAAAGRWANVAADVVPLLPVRPDVAASHEAHVLSTVCVELLQPLAATAGRWPTDTSSAALGRVEVKLRHLEAIEAKLGRSLVPAAAITETRSVLGELRPRSTASRREAAAPSAWFEVAVDEEEVAVARRALLSLAAALGSAAGRSSRDAGYRFRDGPAVVAFWSMKVETCSPGVTQRLALRLARRSPCGAVADATRELVSRLRDEPGHVASGRAHEDLVALCGWTLGDLT